MTPEEIINKQIWEILQNIKEESLAPEEDGTFFYDTTITIIGVGNSLTRERKWAIIHKLAREKVVEIIREINPDWRITESEYNKFDTRLKEKLDDLELSQSKLHQAENQYYITVSYLLTLASRAYDLFKGSEIEERRQLIKLLFQNCKLNGEKLEFDLINPYDSVFVYASRQLWLLKSCSIITDLNIKKILKGFQNIAYVGALRQRWKEIKKPTKEPNLALSSV